VLLTQAQSVFQHLPVFVKHSVWNAVGSEIVVPKKCSDEEGIRIQTQVAFGVSESPEFRLDNLLRDIPWQASKLDEVDLRIRGDDGFVRQKRGTHT